MTPSIHMEATPSSETSAIFF